ncbi:16S rRNA (guanine(527)-N(7))-methyltransferase RsmG [Gordonia defluvii]|uniref:Ribosomal RNA small subunit methyltransferase G n=1 Tax=Gordonia defluvii TaxID=283718 RepID=A0ABN3YBC7_9ACTN|nr:16S rRNA (guanine(527)-N(7))-methyltransferase RsmG [Gordonia sp. UBA5067]
MSVSEAATHVFGDRVDRAVGYHDWLADAAVTRGLIGPREAPRLWDRHILNCGVIAELFGPDERVVDIGSGAGLPGIPLAIARPDLRVVLVEPLLRRTTFLAEVVDALGLDNVTVVRGRAEEPSVIAQHGAADSVTSRAVAPLDRLCGWSAPLMRPDGKMVAMKGSTAQEEVDEHRSRCAAIGIDDLTVTTVGAGLVPEVTTVVLGRRRGGQTRPTPAAPRGTRTERGR